MDRKTKQILSYIFTFAIYAFFFGQYNKEVPGWALSAVLCGGIAFHECGHLWAAKRMGLSTGGFFLYPFLGGVSLITDRYRKFSQQAFVALMGPVAGAILTGIFFMLFLLTGLPVFKLAAEWNALLNMFNLFPLAQMDGGQVLETITFSLNETVGLVIMAISTVVAAVWLFQVAPFVGIFIVLMGGANLYNAYKAWDLRRKGMGYLLTPLPKKQTGKQITYTILGYVATFGSLLALFLLSK